MNNESQKIVTWLKIAGSIFFAIGLIFSLGIWVDYSKIKEVQKWPVTDGQLLMLYQKTSSMGQTNQLIRYRYTVDGKDFESSNINPNQYSQGKEDFFKIKKNNQTKVFVHYNSSNPQEAYLIVDWNPFNSTHFYYAVSSIFFATTFGFILLAIKLKEVKKLASKSSESS